MNSFGLQERSKTKFLNRVRMKKYFKELFKFFISRNDMYHVDLYPEDNSNYVFVGGTDTFGKGLSKKMMTAFAIENKALAVANHTANEESKKRMQLNNGNEFRSSSICP